MAMLVITRWYIIILDVYFELLSLCAEILSSSWIRCDSAARFSRQLRLFAARGLQSSGGG